MDFIMTAAPFHLSHIGWIIDFLAKNRLPAMYVIVFVEVMFLLPLPPQEGRRQKNISL
jgi:hypothetical protein